MKKLLLALVFATAGAMAESTYLDSAKVRNCGGSVELRKADNGDLALKFENVSPYCNKLTFFDASSSRVIKSYDREGSSYTLSKNQREHLSDDCKVGFQLSGTGTYATDTFYVTLGWWCEISKPSQPSYSSNPYSYEVSNKGNCKLMINGQYANKNVNDQFCAPVSGSKNSVSYEFSNKGNCKVMINGQYANQNTSDYYCTVRH